MLKKIIYIFACTTILFFSACLGVLFYVSEQPWVDFSVLEHYNPGKASILLDDEGNEWGRFALDKREVIKLNQIPPCVIHAFLAAEDWSFYSHAGLSFKGIARSVVVNLVSQRKAQGASTITQQLARLLFFESGKSYKRKIKEQVLSIIIERQFTKDQILETYLNHIYLGADIYGVEAACLRFWNKHVRDIGPDEAAILASIVRCPQVYCPLYNTEASRKRRNLILKNMHSLGFLSKKDYESAREKPVAIVKKDTQSLAPHVKEALRMQLEEQLGKKMLYTGGLKIQTSLNRSMQEAAEKTFLEQFTILHKKFSPDMDGALVCIEGETGAIKAMVGGYSFSASQFNRATKARRQLGSSFKPLIFAHTLLRGKTFSDIEIDEPTNFMVNNKEWSPVNATDRFDGPMTLAHALSTSNNIVTIKAFLNSGPEGIVKLAQDAGLNISTAYPSLALGCVDATPLEAACMMNVFAQQGTYVEPHVLEWVKDEWGTKIIKTQTTKRQVMSPLISAQVAKVLTLKIEESKKRNPEKWFACDAFGKTGTTNDARTCWFLGSTPRYTTAIYVGFDDNRSLNQRVFGSQTAFPLWKEFNKAIKNESMHFNFDSSLREIAINAITGAPCAENDPQAIPIFIPSTSLTTENLLP